MTVPGDFSSQSNREAGPLRGIRVLEFGHVLSGPYCGMMLSDLGAEVVKIESPSRPDLLRSAGAFLDGHQESLPFEMVNRGKFSVALDLTNELDRERVDGLIETADILVQNYRPGVAERLGIGYERASGINPKLIHLSISGFGGDSPLTGRGGFDLIAQAMCGLMSVTGDEDGGPTKIGVPITDIAAALYGTIGVLAALREREATGLGQAVDCALFDAGLSFGVWESALVWATNGAPKRTGNAHRALAPYQSLAASDGWFVMAANTNEHFRSLAEVVELPHLPTDPRYESNALRVENRHTLASELEAVTRERKASYWVERLLLVGVPCGEILDFKEALAHSQVASRGMAQTVFPEDGSISFNVLGNVIHLSETPVIAPTTAPRIGRDNERYFSSGVRGDVS